MPSFFKAALAESISSYVTLPIETDDIFPSESLCISMLAAKMTDADESTSTIVSTNAETMDVKRLIAFFIFLRPFLFQLKKAYAYAATAKT
jgi:hypothetical protein